MGLLDNIHRKPRAARKRILIALVSIFGFFALLLWGYTVSTNFTKKELPTEQLEQSKASIFSQMKELFNGLGGEKTPLDKAVEEYKKNN